MGIDVHADITDVTDSGCAWNNWHYRKKHKIIPEPEGQPIHTLFVIYVIEIA